MMLSKRCQRNSKTGLKRSDCGNRLWAVTKRKLCARRKVVMEMWISVKNNRNVTNARRNTAKNVTCQAMRTKTVMIAIVEILRNGEGVLLAIASMNEKKGITK
jgi:hypothetical protein